MDVNIYVISLFRICMCNNRSHLFIEHNSYGYEILQMTTGPSQGISLAIEGGCDAGVNSTFLRQIQALPG